MAMANESARIIKPFVEASSVDVDGVSVGRGSLGESIIELERTEIDERVERNSARCLAEEKTTCRREKGETLRARLKCLTVSRSIS
jgi:hypothetical protein